MVTMLVCLFHFAHEAAGAAGIRHSPRPLWGEGFRHNSGASRREIARSCLDVIARSQRVGPFGRPDDRLRDEAIQSYRSWRRPWIASLALAMTNYFSLSPSKAGDLLRADGLKRLSLGRQPSRRLSWRSLSRNSARMAGGSNPTAVSTRRHFTVTIGDLGGIAGIPCRQNR